MIEFWNAFWAKMFSVENAETLAEVVTVVGTIGVAASVVLMIVAIVGIVENMAPRGDKR